MLTIRDGLFGVTRVPAWLFPVLSAPETQRLRDIRLINTSSPTLPALSDAHRYTHTVGVLGLMLASERRLRHELGEGAVKELLVAAVLHDVGSPPFGHLWEYLLKAETGWTHEGMLKEIIAGTYRPDGKYHQVYYGRGLSLERVLEGCGVDPGRVASIVEGTGHLGPLLAGSVDYDNIDNVYRMASLLGLNPNVADAHSLAGRLAIRGDALALTGDALPDLVRWRELRRQCYQILAFDESTLQTQAMLTDALSAAMQAGMLGAEHWFFTDDAILVRLAETRLTTSAARNIKIAAQRFKTGDLYSTVSLGWYDIAKAPADDLRHPRRREELRQRLEERLHIPCTPYVFYDSGTFSKRIDVDVLSGDGSTSALSVGETSHSTIIGVFTSRHMRPTRARRELVVEVLEEYGFPSASLRPLPRRIEGDEFAGQAELPL